MKLMLLNYFVVNVRLGNLISLLALLVLTLGYNLFAYADMDLNNGSRKGVKNTLDIRKISNLDISKKLDCAIGEELKQPHEGILGSVVPQAYWNYYYNVGYDPADGFLYKVHYEAGVAHSSNSTLLSLSDYRCDDNGDPYKSGRVAGQVMWKILHGNSVNGSTISTMPRPASDRDFMNLTYWAAELVDTSIYKDRYEFANRVVQIMEKNSTLSSTGKSQ